MTKEEIEELVRELDDPELTKIPGHVAMIWQDGEYTSQKAGELLWQRTLHCFEIAIPGAAELKMVFPHAHGENSFAWVTPKNAYRVRAAIRELLGVEGTDHLAALLSREES